MLSFLLVPFALADTDCATLCSALDAAEESCEAAHGEDDALCVDIGLVEETCDPEDGGTTAACPTLCADIDALDDACDAERGPTDPVCRALDALAEDCAGGQPSGATLAPSCSVVGGSAGFALALGMLGLVRLRAR